MTFNELIKDLSKFKTNNYTEQFWSKDNNLIKFDNDYIEVKEVATSNVTGGSNVNHDKQWSIIYRQKKSFTHLTNWIKLQNYFLSDIKITPVLKGVNKGCYGIRLYKMASEPTISIINNILDFIFN